MADEKSKQTIYERAEIGEKVIFQLREMLKDAPVEVIGHLDSVAVCCSGGTVAIVKVDLDRVTTPRAR
ncbi:MAG: hypothetical protein U1E42_05300 [Rhodospirillales bacterium]